VCTLEPRLNIGENIFAWGNAELFLRFIAKHSRNYQVRKQSGKRFGGKNSGNALLCFLTFPQFTL
jgi:hypothetical protein